MNYIIYKNKKIPTQSGDKKNKYWVLECISVIGVSEDLLTGWKSINNNYDKKIKFSDKEEAIDYAKKNSLDYEVVSEKQKEIKNKSYAENFKFRRVRTDI